GVPAVDVTDGGVLVEAALQGLAEVGLPEDRRDCRIVEVERQIADAEVGLPDQPVVFVERVGAAGPRRGLQSVRQVADLDRVRSVWAGLEPLVHLLIRLDRYLAELVKVWLVRAAVVLVGDERHGTVERVALQPPWSVHHTPHRTAGPPGTRLVAFL